MNSVSNALRLRGVFKEGCDEVPALEETAWSVRSMGLKNRQQAYEKMLNLTSK